MVLLKIVRSYQPERSKLEGLGIMSSKNQMQVRLPMAQTTVVLGFSVKYNINIAGSKSRPIFSEIICFSFVHDN